MKARNLFLRFFRNTSCSESGSTQNGAYMWLTFSILGLLDLLLRCNVKLPQNIHPRSSDTQHWAGKGACVCVCTYIITRTDAAASLCPCCPWDVVNCAWGMGQPWESPLHPHSIQPNTLLGDSSVSCWHAKDSSILWACWAMGQYQDFAESTWLRSFGVRIRLG